MNKRNVEILRKNKTSIWTINPVSFMLSITVKMNLHSFRFMYFEAGGFYENMEYYRIMFLEIFPICMTKIR